MRCCTDSISIRKGACVFLAALVCLCCMPATAQNKPILDAAPPRPYVDPSDLDPRVRAASATLENVDNGKPATAQEWEVVCEAAGLHPAIQSITVHLRPFPGDVFVGMLTHPKFAVRSGALEILEDKTNDDFGFDPWMPGSDASKVGLVRWQAWLKPDEKSTKVADVKAAEPPMDEAKMRGWFVDLAGTDVSKHERAISALARQGMRSVAALEQYLHDTPQLSQGVQAKLKEAQYRLVIGESLSKEAPVLARQLVFGTRDLKLEALRQLPRIRDRAIPIIAEFLADGDALIREAAMDALILAGEESVYDLVTERLKVETDENVIQAVLRRVSPKETRGGKLLASFVTSPNEDLAVAALNALSDGASDAAQPQFKECISDKRWRVRVAALEYAGKVTNRAAEKDVLNAFSDSDEFVRYAAMKAAADMKLEDAVSRIVAMALKDDSVTGAAVEAIVRMGKPIPDELINVLPGKPGDVLLVVLRAFVQHAGHDGEQIDFGKLNESTSSYGSHNADGRAAAMQAIKIVRMLAKHRDPDVRVAAMQVLGQHLVDPADKRLVYDALVSAPDDEARVAILSGIKPGGFDFRESTAPEPKDDGQTEVADSNDLFAQVLATPAPRNRVQEDVYTAFGVKLEVPGAPAVAVRQEDGRTWQPMDKEFNDLLTKGLESEKGDFAFLCAMHLALGGQHKAADGLLRMLPRLEPHQRVHVAELLIASRHMTNSRAGRPLLRALLQDESKEAREFTVYAVERAESAPALHLLLSEVALPEAKLRPSEAYNYSLADLTNNSSKRSIFVEWAKQVLVDPKISSGVKALALTLLGTTGSPDALPLVQAHLRDPDVWQRRAAYRALWRLSRSEFELSMATIAADSSPRVREIMPAGYIKHEREYVDVWFGERDSEKEVAPYRRDRVFFSLTPEVESVLKKLSADTDPGVRIEAMIALLSWRRDVDPLALREALVGLDEERRKEAVLNLLNNEQWRQYSPRYGFILDYAEPKWFSSEWAQMVAKLRPESKRSGKLLTSFSALVKDEPPKDNPVSSPSEESATSQRSEASGADIVFFYKPGCKDCERTRDMLRSIGRAVTLNVMESNIESSDGARWNEVLCQRFGVESKLHQVSPAVFTQAGALVKTDITMEALQRLMDRTLAEPEKPGWHSVDDAQRADAGGRIESRYSGLSAGIVLGAGLLDGINPCAFATIIFFLSYLHVARRKPHEILMVGSAFIVAVFLAYFAVGLGMSKIVAEVQAFAWVRTWLNRVLALVALLLAWLSFRDGLRAMRGRLGDMSLQLPDFLKSRIRGVIRTQSRTRNFVIAAFASGVIVSFLELACTGQVYLPTIVYMMNQGSAGALFWLLVYNLAFVAPLIVIFILAWSGMRSEMLAAWQKRHTALVRFATSVLFLALWGVLMIA